MGEEMQVMNIIKRSGEEVRYDRSKIVNAVSKANVEVDPIRRLNPSQIEAVADNVEKQLRQYTHAANVEDIQDLVETGIMEMRGYEVAQAYMHYRDKRTALRRSNTTDRKILSLINRNNELVKQENANKNPTINSTQRDYIAGEVSRDLTRRLFLPEDIVKAHEEGIIHFHDADYFAMREHNCDLINLDDMLQNGTVISGTKIDKPHSFYTACNITTQIVAQVASNQYGGQSFSLYHVSKFVDVSRQSLRARTRADLESAGIAASDEQVNQIAERRLKKEIKSGIQTIQYQLITLMTCNGQAPFVTMFMYLDEAPEGQPRRDLALCIPRRRQHRTGHTLLLFDRSVGAVHREAHGAGLHLSQGDETAQSRQRLHLHGVPLLFDRRADDHQSRRQPQVLRPVQPGRRDHQPR